MYIVVTLFLLLASPFTASVQPTPTQGTVSSLVPVFTFIRSNLAKGAAQMPEIHYNFKPTPDVRSFGQLVGHVANAAFVFCSAAIGEASSATIDYEKSATTKDALMRGLEQALSYCDEAYKMPDTKASEVIEFMGTKGTRLYVLTFNIAHDFEHYGNMVTYMRLKGLVPPSSQGR